MTAEAEWEQIEFFIQEATSKEDQGRRRLNAGMLEAALNAYGDAAGMAAKANALAGITPTAPPMVREKAKSTLERLEQRLLILATVYRGGLRKGPRRWKRWRR